MSDYGTLGVLPVEIIHFFIFSRLDPWMYMILSLVNHLWRLFAVSKLRDSFKDPCYYPEPTIQLIAYHAAINRYNQLLLWALNLEAVINDKLVWLTARAGHLIVLKWLETRSFKRSFCIGNNPDYTYLKEVGFPPSNVNLNSFHVVRNIYQGAGESHNREMIDWAFAKVAQEPKENKEICRLYILNGVIKGEKNHQGKSIGSSLSVYVYTHPQSNYSYCFEGIKTSTDVELLRLYYAKFPEDIPHNLTGHIKYGNGKVIREIFAILQNHPIILAQITRSTEYCRKAVSLNRLKLLKILQAEGCAWDHQVTNLAVTIRDRKILCWCLEAGAPYYYCSLMHKARTRCLTNTMNYLRNNVIKNDI
jgi:hypothetical protein